MKVLLAKTVFVLQPADLHHLATEADEDRGSDVRVRGVAPEHTLQSLQEQVESQRLALQAQE